MLVVQLAGNSSLKLAHEAGSLSGRKSRFGWARFCRLPRNEIASEILDLTPHFADLLLVINHQASIIRQTSSILLQCNQASLDIGESSLNASNEISADRQLAGNGFIKTIHRFLEGVDLPIHLSYIVTYLAQKMQGMAFWLRHVRVSLWIGLKYIFFFNRHNVATRP
jgi:hypothetical protein